MLRYKAIAMPCYYYQYNQDIIRILLISFLGLCVK